MARRTIPGWLATSKPATVADPPSMGRSVVNSLMVVVLPAPLGPSTLRMEPAGTEKLRSLTATFWPKDLHSPWATMTDPLVVIVSALIDILTSYARK